MKKKFNLPSWAVGVLALAAAFVAWKVWRSLRAIPKTLGDTLKSDVQIKAIQNASWQYGIDPGRAEALQVIAKDIYDAFWNHHWGLMEDEEKATNAMNKCRSTNEAKFVAIIYRQNFNKDLWSNFDEYCNFFDPTPRTELLNAIKGI